MIHTKPVRTHSVRFPQLLSKRLPAFSAALCIIALALPAFAAKPRPTTPGAVIVVNGDPGGSVSARYNEIQTINQLQQKVELRRGNCMSSCTMFLGVANVCVTPSVTLGFHGPTRPGAKLTQEEFDEWSRVIAAHYPEAVRNWYMQKARYKTYIPARLSGSELIRLGVPRCT